MPTLYAADKGAGNNESPHAEKSPKHKLLEKIRRRFDYHVRAWKDIRDAAEKDMRAQSKDGPWDPTDREERVRAGRPCIHLDQLEEKTNNLVNEVRLNPLAIKINPAGEGSDEKTAQLRDERVRQIQYDSNAAQSCVSAFESAAQRSYGVFGLKVDYESWDSFELKIGFRRFGNPDAVSWDPDWKEADCSDMVDAFVLDRVLKDDFPERFPGATITSFGDEEINIAPAWFDDDSVQIAEYWYVEKKRRTMYKVEGPTGPKVIFADEWKDYKVQGGMFIYADGSEVKILDERETEQRTVKQCLTNGVEILDETEWLGSWIPIFPVLGKEKWIRSGNKTERTLESYIRKAIDAQMLFDYYKTCEAEEVGQTPKTPYWMYEGQDEGQKDVLANLHKVPRAYTTVKATTEATGNQLLPLPQRIPYQPNIQAMEIGAEAARRAIQAAVGSYGYTRLDDTNVKSGKAINLLDRQSDMGSFHFIDNLQISMRHAGRCLNELLDKVETGPRDVGLRKPDGTYRVERINEASEDANGKPQLLRYSNKPGARHDVTIEIGPSYQSQREEAATFVDTLAQNQNVFPLIADLAVKLKNLGPIGEQISERFKKMLPPQLQDEEGQPQVPPQLQQMMEQLNAALEDAMKHIDELEQEKQAKVVELQAKNEIEEKKIAADQQATAAEMAHQLRLEEIRAELERAKMELDWKIAQLNNSTKAAIADEQMTHKENLAEHSAGEARANTDRQHEHEQRLQDTKPQPQNNA